MRLKKRLFAAVAATVVAAITLSGCGGASEPSGSTPTGEDDLSGQEINFWWFKNNSEEDVMDRLAVEFEKETGIKVNVSDDVAYADYFGHLTNAVAAGNAPDAAEFNSVLFGQLVDQGVIADISDEVDAWSGKDDVDPGLWPGVQDVNGEATYAMPLNFLMFILLYRKDLLEAAGVEVPKTQDEFVAASKKLASVKDGQYGFMVRAGANGQDNWTSFLIAGGARIVEDGKVALNSAEARAANDKYISTFADSPPGSINTTSGLQLVQTLEAGTASMIIDNIGGARSLTLGPDQVGAAVLPSQTGDPSTTTYMGGLNMTGVLASSQKKAAAFKWISWLAEHKAQLEITKSTAGYLPVTTSVMEDPSFADDIYFQASIDATKQGVIVWPALPGVTKAATQVWQPLFQGALLGQNSNDAVLEGVSDALEGK